MTNEQLKKRNEIATLGGGCFWCTEAVFLRLRGVTKVTSGYTGGTVDNPTYRQICTGKTGHAEVVRIEFDPEGIAFTQILDVFFHTHDPTTLNRQGADVGTQYRSSVFWADKEQKEVAAKVIKNLDDSGEFDSPIVTTLEELGKFYPAEDYHQNYFDDNPRQGYCEVVINPKVTKFQKRYKELLKKSVVKTP
jgi:peptide-methionine (S)-S-oxide reductase